MDLGGLPIHQLEIEEGGGTSEIKFGAIKPDVMESFVYRSGTADIALYGLANANFKQMTFDGGAGDHKFDFSGELQQDAAVTIKVGLSDVEIRGPEGVSARVELEGGLSQVDLEGDWTEEGSQYENPGSGPQLSIRIDMGAGSLRVVNE